MLNMDDVRGKLNMDDVIDRIEKARQKYQRLDKEQGKKEDEAMNIHFRGMIK